ncbi:MAG: hypothetical protein Q4D55_07460 [Eubacteriales bacterium]|nr:hypothetical protein [Eubacteriales bacterium]
MEQILNKLSEIEATAQGIINDGNAKKKALSWDMERQCKEFDAAFEQEMEDHIRSIRQNLETEKDAQLTALRSSTEAAFQRLDAYYEKNHERLSRELFDKIVKGTV